MKRYGCHSRKASVRVHFAVILSGEQRSRRTPSQVVPRDPSTSLGMTETVTAPRWLFRLTPDNIFAIPAIDKSVHLTAFAPTKQNPAFNAFAEKDIGHLRIKLFALSF